MEGGKERACVCEIKRKRQKMRERESSCVHVCVRTRETEGEKETENTRERERERARGSARAHTRTHLHTHIQTHRHTHTQCHDRYPKPTDSQRTEKIACKAAHKESNVGVERCFCACAHLSPPHIRRLLLQFAAKFLILLPACVCRHRPRKAAARDDHSVNVQRAPSSAFSFENRLAAAAASCSGKKQCLVFRQIFF